MKRKSKNLSDKLRTPPERGHKVGTKRSDKRWQDEHGEIWASRFECLVYNSGKTGDLKIRKCDKGGRDTLSYHSKVRDGVCSACKSPDIIKERRYTPDLRVLSDNEAQEGGYYVEAKGYMRASQRSLVRDFFKTGPPIDLRFILQADYRVSRSLTMGGWIDKFLHCKWAVWDGEAYPTKWNQNEKRVARKAIRKIPKDLR